MIFVTLALVAIMSISCTDDFTNPKNLNGTTWRCSTFPVTEMSMIVEYIEVKFTSTTTGKSYYKMKNEDATKLDTFTYTIVGDKITIISEGKTSPGVGTIDKKTMTFIQDGVTLVFTKQ